jgi:small subunit ribosomal protein S1
MADKALISMDELLLSSPDIFIPEPGTVVDGKVITVQKNKILVDLGGVSTGIISGKEAVDSLDTISSLVPGDTVSAFILEPENDEGLIVLSLRKASQQKTWKRFLDYYNNKEVIKVKITEANKGGLLVEVDAIKGFIPVSQLAPLHYPRVNGADSAKILARLQKLVGEMIDVRIINIDEENRKLILSEKEAQNEVRSKALKNIEIGQIVDGKISGVVNFGIFVTFEGLEGLVHISEIAWGHVDDPSNFGRLGDPVKIKVIGIEGEKISLSMKQLTVDPWLEIAKNFKEGQKVSGKINRITEYGAFVTLADDINGLIHVSEINDPEIKDKGISFKVGDDVSATIINIDVDNHRIGLSILGKKPTKDAPVTSITELGLSDKVMLALEKAGIKSIDDLKGKDAAALTEIEGVNDSAAKKILAKLA